MPLYGHEFKEEIDPLSVDLGWAVDLNKEFRLGPFPSQDCERRAGTKDRRPEFEGPRIARQGMPV